MTAPGDLRTARYPSGNELWSETTLSAVLFHRFIPIIQANDGTSASGLDAALLVLTRVLSAMPDEWRSHLPRDSDSDETRAIRHHVQWWDAANPLLRFLWGDFPRSDIPAHPESECSLRLWQDARRMFPVPSFANIISCAMMEQTLWNRDPLLLATGYKFYGIVKELVRHHAADVSLFAWTGRDADGDRRPLADAINAIFSLSNDGVVMFGHWGGEPTSFRVLYTPGQHESNPYRFGDLLTIVVDPFQSFTAEEKALLAADGQSPHSVARQYRLVAVVRQRATPAEEDRVRVYLHNGMRDQGDPSARPGYSDSWKLGDPGHTYALLYVRTDVRALAWANTAEVAETGVDVAERGHRQKEVLSAIVNTRSATQRRESQETNNGDPQAVDRGEAVGRGHAMDGEEAAGSKSPFPTDEWVV